MQKKIFTLLIVLYPILSAYIVIGSLDLGVALCALFGGMLFFKRGYKVRSMPKGWRAFLLYLLITSIVITHAFPARVLLYTLILLIGFVLCDFDLIYKYYKKVAIYCIGLFFFQEFVRITTGINVSGIITFLPIIYGDASDYVQGVIMNSDRSSSFFLEPSYFAQYLFPLVVIELFSKRKNSLRNALFLTVVVFLIRSGNGIVLLTIIWGIWMFYSNVKRSTKLDFYIIAGVSFLGIIAYRPELILDITNRTSELSLSGADEQWQSSGFIRFFRGYYLYFSLPFIHQLFGLNPGKMDYYMSRNSLGLFDADASFLNGVQTILCLYGLFGLFFVLRYLYLNAKGSSLDVVVLTVGTIYLLLSESYFISGRMLLVMIIIHRLRCQKNEDFIYNQYLSSRK